MTKKDKGNPCGIVGLSVGWLFPLAGLVLGIVALGRGERHQHLGILSIISAVIGD